METQKFTWTEFYTEFADKLMPFKNNRDELLSILKAGQESFILTSIFLFFIVKTSSTGPFLPL